VSHVPIHGAGVWPIAFDRNRSEATAQHQLLGDPHPHAVELRRPVGRFAEQHDSRIANSFQQPIELRILDPIDGFGALCD
jgi:hypothetical protein